MFGAIKRLLGFGTKNAWIDEQRRNLRKYLTEELGTDEGLDPDPVWTFAPYVALWSIPKGWAISDAVVCFHIVGRNDILRSSRDAARHFARHFRISAEGARADGSTEIAEGLELRATALLGSVGSDETWDDKLRPSDGNIARLADRTLAELLAAGEDDPRLGPLVRVVHAQMKAPGGTFHGIYVYLDLRRENRPELVFDAAARQIMAFETRFAPLVAFRVEYALVAFGLNFGEPERELALERHGDEFRVRHPEVSKALNHYSPQGDFPLALHFVDDNDTPFTAHVCAKKAADYRYKAEDKFFDVRTHPFHKSLEQSESVEMRLLANSIAPEVIEQARRAFRERGTQG